MILRNKIISLSAMCLLLLSVCTPPRAYAAVSGAAKKIESLKNPNGEILGVSSRGSLREYAENSLEAIKKAAETGIDFVAVDIKKTSDGQLIIFSDDTTERMLFTDKIMNISETDFKTLSSFNLRLGCGGKNAPETLCKIPTLRQLTALSKSLDIALILRASADILPDISALLFEEKAANNCVVVMRDGTANIAAALEKCSEKPYIAGIVKGNVIFAISSFVNKMHELGAIGVELKSTNRYGINYQKAVLGAYCGKIRLIADTTVPEECGARQDTEIWWDDLISRGYSVIITDYPERFTEYKTRAGKSRMRLQAAAGKYKNDDSFLPEFRNKYLNDYKKAYDDARIRALELLSDGSSPVSELDAAYTSLMKAVNDINKNYSLLETGREESTFTVPRVILCICAAAAVIAVQVFFFKKRRKTDG